MAGKPANIEAVCDTCGGGYVLMNPQRDSAPCLHRGCGGTVFRIHRVVPPQEWEVMSFSKRTAMLVIPEEAAG